MLDQVLNKIKALAELNERAEKAAAAQNAVEVLSAQKAWRDAKRGFTHKIRNRKDEAHTTIKLSLYNKAKNFIHSTLGGNRLVDDDYVLNQRAEADVRNGRRWIDRLPTRMHDSLVNINRYFMTTSGTPASIVAEGDPKPQREKVQNLQTFQLQKLAVTDLVTQEAVYALRNERFADYLVDAHLEHLLDRLEQQITSAIASNAFVFNSGLFAGYSTSATGQATWHDLLQAMQKQHDFLFADHFVGEKFGNIFITYHRTLYGILTDRNGFGRDYLSAQHDISSFVLSDDFFWWSEAMFDIPTSADRGLLLNTDNFELHMLDAADLYFERVVDAADERNLYRITAEVYFVVVPRFLGGTGWPAVVSNNTLTDRNGL